MDITNGQIRCALRQSFSAISYLILIFIICSNLIPIFSQQEEASFVMDTIVSDLEFPTGIAFLGPQDILVTEKNKGTVQRIVNGQMLQQPLLDVAVANEVERGLLGIAVSKNYSAGNKTYVFLYYTEAKGEREEGGGGAEEEGGEREGEEDDDGEPIGNRLYRYELVDNKLINPKLLLDLPYLPGPAHNGGVITIGPDNNVYVVVGNLHSKVYNKGQEITLAQNIKDGKEPDGRGGVLRVTQDGKLVDGKGIMGNEYPLNMYYAYGIRNSFGINFDPVTGNLWDTENAPGFGDEINLVEPGFNSGFNQISGSSSRDNKFDSNTLENFNGRGIYSDPELDLGQHIAPTAIVFFHSDKFGDQYENDMFVGTARGTIFHFDLNENRTELILDGPLADKVTETEEDLEDVTFIKDIGTITDLEVGPDGYLYGTNYSDNGTIFRILPSIHAAESTVVE